MINTDKSLRNKVIYQIFTRNYKAGTFEAVRADLKRIKGLGVDIIYLLPIHPSGKINRKGSMGSPYAISDYRAIDPVQGTLEDFKGLCDAVHEAGMQIIIDVVYNHTSPDSVLAQNHPEWFYHKKDGSLGNRIGDWWDVVDLDYTDKNLWDYQIDTLKMWAEYVDGFRCDVAPMVPYEFWQRAREEVERVRNGCIWIAESIERKFIYENRRRSITTLTDGELYQVFDICYDYDVYEFMSGAMTGGYSLDKYIDEVNNQEMIYPENYIKLRNLENHDRPRAATLVPEEDALLNWTAWNYFQKGIVMLYAGEEMCATHHPTLFDLDTVDFEGGRDISEFLAKLSQIKSNEIFKCSSFNARVSGPEHNVIVAVHEGVGSLAGQQAVGVFSLAGKITSVHVDLQDGIYKNEIDGSAVDVFEGIIRTNGAPIIIFA